VLAVDIGALAEVQPEALATPVLEPGPHAVERRSGQLFATAPAGLDRLRGRERMFARHPDRTAVPSYAGAVTAGRKSTESSRAVRRRRTPEEAQHEIIRAAELLLRERPFRELTVDEVMKRTELSRPSFYVYFRDRHELVLRVVERLGGELFTMSERWFRGEGDGAVLAREAVEGIVAVYAEHGPVLRALSDAAVHDPDLEVAYATLVQGFVDATSRHIDAEIAAGRILPVDAEQTARALVWMIERYLNLALGREPITPVPVVVETLATIVGRVLYGVR
jgi:AcrR family transcriptional regulator